MTKFGECIICVVFSTSASLFPNRLVYKLEYFLLLQNDIDAACAVVDPEFQPVLKPYQLVGVNFLLLLHRKGIGGGTCSNLLTSLLGFIFLGLFY